MLRDFAAGIGRSGLIGKVFTIRMMHSYVIAETITPTIEARDLLLIIPGSSGKH